MKVQRLGAALLTAAIVHVASATDAARGEEIVAGRCFICHGNAGESSSPLFPRLAGQNAVYVARQLADFQSGRRKSSTMQPLLDGLTTADFVALGAYFASRPTHVHPVEDAALAQAGRSIYHDGNPASGVAACASCHGPKAEGSENLPRLAGQHAQYTERQLRQFASRDRANDGDVMGTTAAKLTNLERRAVAAYLAGLQ
jgi:cytochrome c553